MEDCVYIEIDHCTEGLKWYDSGFWFVLIVELGHCSARFGLML